MTKEEHDAAVASLKEICRDLGCTKHSPSICDDAPQNCGIIRKILMPQPNPRPVNNDEQAGDG